MPIGNHVLTGSYVKDGQPKNITLNISVEEVGIIQLSEEDIAKYGYNVNGFVNDNTISFKVNFVGDSKEVEFNGEFDGPKVINGQYNTNADDNYDAEGGFALKVDAWINTGFIQQPNCYK